MNLQENNISANNFEQCIKCTVCTVYCPVVPVRPEYPGPKQAGPDGERLRLKRGEFFDEALKYCLNCKRCEVACPSNVRIGDIIQSARIRYSKHRPTLRDRILANTDVVGGLATIAAPVTNFALSLKPVKLMMDAVLKVDSHRSFPKYSGEKFVTWFNRNAQASQAQYPRQVSFFHGCYINYNYPQLGKDLVSVLNAFGYGVNLLEDEKCCGVALISNGLISQARKQAELNTASIRRAVSQGRKVVVASSTCTLTIREEYEHLLGVENADVRSSIDLATRFVYRLIDEGAKVVFNDDFKLRVAYHTACHMERLGWGFYSISLLRSIPGVKLTVLPSKCCGIAGTYGFKKENYATSQGIGESLFADIADASPDVVATDCETCKWQIEMSTPFKVEHPISILARALDLEKTKQLNK